MSDSIQFLRDFISRKNKKLKFKMETRIMKFLMEEEVANWIDNFLIFIIFIALFCHGRGIVA